MKHGNEAESSEPIPGTVLVKFKRMNPFIYYLTFVGNGVYHFHLLRSFENENNHWQRHRVLPE